MPTTKLSSRIIPQVERAADALRRGEAVLLEMGKAERWAISAGEYEPKAKAITQGSHPAVQLMKIAGLLPRAVLRRPGSDCADMLTIMAAAIKQYPQALVAQLRKVSEAKVPLAGAEHARIVAFRPRFGHEEHLAVIVGNPAKSKAPFVRIHSSCVTGDVFGSLRCDCGNQLHKALAIIAEQGAGVVLYLSQEGRGIGIASKLRAYGLQDGGMDTVEANEALGFAADERDFALAGAMLRHLKLQKVTLITNNPAKIKALVKHGIAVEKRVPLITEANTYSRRYLDTKAHKMGHKLGNSFTGICDTQ